ncbi:MAG: OmpA/MotB domain protein [Myxococcales bacterium]|nr:OmpA/MotB domain protein [Myxococcales bacterium]
MAKLDDEDSFEKPGKPTKVRRFPWRLWFYAILMTGAAGAGGYFAWQYRTTANKEHEAADACLQAMGPLKDSAGKCSSQAADLQKTLDGTSKKAGELEKQNGEFMKNINASKEELAQLRAQKAEAEKREAVMLDFQKQFAKMIDTGQLKVSARRGSLVLSLPAEVLFPSGSADLSKEGELAVLEVGINLKKFPDRRFLVIGHTDSQPLAKMKVDPTKPAPCVFKDNWELSTARALTVTRFLVQAGMDPKNLIPSGSGQFDPVADNGNPKERARNRRIEIALLPAINELPPLPKGIGEEQPKK